MKFSAAFFILLGALLLGTPAWAQGDASVYRAASVTVELPAMADTSRARDRAVAEATRKGLRSMFRAITPRETWSQHDALMEGLDENRVLERFIINEEKTSPQYRLNVDLFFNREVVRQALLSHKIPFGEARRATFLVLPLLEIAGRRMLWQEDNPWRLALEGATAGGGQVRFVLPLGDMTEMAMLTPEMVAFGAADSLLELAHQYGATGAVVSWARFGYREGQRVVEVENSWYGVAGMAPFTSQVAAEDENYRLSLDRAALETVTALADAWRRQDIVEPSQEGRVFVRYSPAGPADLEKVSATLEGVEVVKNVLLRVFNIRNSLFQVDYFGNPSQLESGLAQKGLHVRREGPVWRVSFTPFVEENPFYGGNSSP